MGFSPGGYDVLPGRQIATVVSALAKASHVLAIDGHDKAQILPKIRDAVNEHVTGIWWRCGRSAGLGCLAANQDHSSEGQSEDANKRVIFFHALNSFRSLGADDAHQSIRSQ
jgi:hypothetical protein